jgi:peptidoglycan-associated lipoprotein
MPVLAAGVFAACSKAKPPAPPAPAPVAAPAPAPVVERPAPTPTPPPVTSGPTEAEINAKITEIRNTLMKPIYFEYDKDVIRDDSKSTLDDKVTYLQQFPQVRIRIAGNTDERGSAEYNVALGQRRAAAAQRYLAGRGIAEGRFDIVSYGEERPAMQGTGEASFSKNRRDEFEIVAGGDQIHPRMGR